MSKKKHPEHVNHERWLVSYADFITLLFAFFVVLFASGQTDKRKQMKLAEAMQTAFVHHGIFDPHSATPPLADETGSLNSAPTPLALSIPASPAAAPNEAEIAERIRQVVRRQDVAAHRAESDTISVRATPEGLVVSLREAGFFDSGSAEVRSAAVSTVRAVAATLPHQAMRVEGHTDDLPIHTVQFATNWELSTARAAAITHLLLNEHAAAPEQVSAAGYAEFRPIAGNDTEAGRARNRRVDIVLLRPIPVPTQTTGLTTSRTADPASATPSRPSPSR